MVDSVLLVEAVRQRRTLWDRNNANYSNRQIFNNLWKEIGAELGCNEHEARKKWANLRDYFHRMHRYLCRDDANSRMHRRKKWFLYDSMTFLLPHLKSYTINVKNEEDSNKSTEPVKDASGLHFEFDDILSQTSSIPLSDSNIDRDRSHECEEPEDDDIVEKKPLLSLIERNGKPVHSNRKIYHGTGSGMVAVETFDSKDEDELFLRSLIPKMKLMNTHQKMTCQAEMIMLMLKHIKLSQESSLSFGAATQSTNVDTPCTTDVGSARGQQLSDSSS
ncbi:hypothetical protein EGW08_001677 [Elysia chlorotica]|uniref:MADF domain-containing protein n=1 Tax=Elysia chlorotica TaxID=188477 RepID=A0A3S1I1X9_ELYCH|nr:hypothetical protein EGW08_001677 [Elysia chlorotica]